MRRRWLLILGGAVVIGVATVLALALLIPRGPFRFLDGHRPLQASRPVREAIGLPSDVSVYSFRADYDTLKRRAQSEFARSESLPPSAGPFTMETFTRGSGAKEEAAAIIRDLRFSRLSDDEVRRVFGAAWMGEKPSDKGWVTVFAYNAPEPALWDRIKAVFGL